MNKSESGRMTKVYRNLIIDCITEDAPTDKKERPQFVKDRLITEKLREGQHITFKHILDWLQGLCSTVSVPCYNDEIIALYETNLGRQLSDLEIEKALKDHFVKCAMGLSWFLRGTI